MITVYRCKFCGAAAVTDAAITRHERACQPWRYTDQDPRYGIDDLPEPIDTECEGCS